MHRFTASLAFLLFGVAAALKFDGGISLSQLPTPALLIDVDELPAGGVDVLPSGPDERRAALKDVLFVHARVVAAGQERAGFYQGRGAPLAELDVPLAGDAYLATGLDNNWSYDNSYFWARNLGSGARRPAPGLGLSAAGDRTAVRWLRDDEPGAPQTGDGKFSEWAEFLAVGDRVDLVPVDVDAWLDAHDSAYLVTREARPPGAEPLVRAEPWAIAARPAREAVVVDISTMDALDTLLAVQAPGALTLLEAYATNCPKCKRLKPKFAAFAAQHPDVTCVAVNLSTVAGAYKTLEVATVPSFFAFADGERIDDLPELSDIEAYAAEWAENECEDECSVNEEWLD